MDSLESRIRDKSLLSLITTADKLVPLFGETVKRTLNIGWSGFTPVGYPKVMPVAIADYVEQNGLQGKWRFNLYTGASSGAECDDRWAELKMINKRWPYQTGKHLAKGINCGEISMGDKHLSSFAQDLFYGFYTMEDGGSLDYAIVEASAITEDGNIVLTGGVGAAPEIIAIADKIIVEINTLLPSLEGMHDILLPENPPHRRPIPLMTPSDRVGTTYVPTDKSKIIAIIASDKPDRGRSLRGTDEMSSTIAEHILDFFMHEIKAGRLPENLLPLQSGVGSVANAVMGALIDSPFTGLTMYSEVFQDTFLDFLDSGKCDMISCSSLSLSQESFERWWKNYDYYKSRVILRPQHISNHPELIRRMGVVSMNTPVEFDIYGHVNSSLVAGTRMLNGLGGSNDFARNAYISIMHCPSVRPGKTDPFGISSIVPKVSHVDHTEHDIAVVVTEQGLADLRGLAPKERARVIIDKCAHPAYKDYLMDYFDRACVKTGYHHEPHILKEAYDVYTSLEEKGTMRFWDVK